MWRSLPILKPAGPAADRLGKSGGVDQVRGIADWDRGRIGLIAFRQCNFSSAYGHYSLRNLTLVFSPVERDTLLDYGESVGCVQFLYLAPVDGNLACHIALESNFRIS